MRNGEWLQAQRFPPLEHVVPGIIPEGSTLFVGPPKAGKSLAVLGISLAVAAGGHALGAVPVGKPRPVLYLALEDGDRRLQERCWAQMEDAAIPAKFEYLTRIIPAKAIDTLREWLAKRYTPEAPCVTVLDTLGKVTPPSLPGESAYGRDYRIGSQLKQVIDDFPGSGLIVVHHDRKAGSDDFVDSVSGTHGLAGAADTIIVLSRDRGETRGLLKVTGRDVTEAEYAIELGAGGLWRIAGGTLEESARQAVTHKATASLGDRSVDVFAEVTKHPGGIGPAAVAEAISLDAKQTAVYLGRLVESGRIRKLGRGLYSPLRTPVVSVVSVGSDDPTPPSNTTLTTHPTPTRGDAEAPDDDARWDDADAAPTNSNSRESGRPTCDCGEPLLLTRPGRTECERCLLAQGVAS